MERVSFPWAQSHPLERGLSTSTVWAILPPLVVSQWMNEVNLSSFCISFPAWTVNSEWSKTSSPQKSQVRSFFINSLSIINYAFETCFLTVIVPFSLLQLLLLFCFHYLLFCSRTTSEMALSSSCFVRGADKYTLLALANSANTMEMEDENDKTRTWFFDCFSSSSDSSLLRVVVYLGCGSLCHVN